MSERPRILEIRTHGVTGTPPQDILADEAGPLAPGDIVQVPYSLEPDRGFRQLRAAQRRVAPIGDNPDHRLWAYHWGRMTSGSWRKALWAALVPFALVNVAHAMLPDHRGGYDSQARRAVTRLLGLALTVLFTVQLSAVVYDTLARRCFGEASPEGSACLANFPFADTFRGDPVRLAWAATALVLAILLIGAAVTALTDVDTRGALEKSDKTDPPRRPAAEKDVPLFVFTPDDSALAPDSLCGLERDDFYDGDLTAPILRTVHGIAAPTAVALMILVISDNPWWGWLVPLLVLVLLCGVLILVDMFDQQRLLRRLNQPSTARAVKYGGWALGLLPYAGVITLVSLRAEELHRATDPGVLDRIDITILTLLAVCAALWLGLLAGLLPSIRRNIRRREEVPQRYRTWLYGAAPVVFAGLGVMLGAGFGAGLTQVLVRLGGSDGPIAVPQTYDVIALQWGLAALLTLVLGGAALLIGAVLVWAFGDFPVAEELSGLRPAKTRDPATDGSPDTDQGPARQPSVRAYRVRVWLSGLNQHAHLVLAAVFVIAAGALLVAIGLHAYGAGVPGLAWLRLLGSLLLLGFIAVLGFAIQRAIQDRDGIGRSLGVLWDLACFWPREGHPVVPPAYAPQVVTDIVRRVRQECAVPGTHLNVVLCGHSQGSLLMYAAALRLARHPGLAGNVSLLTYGSQLQWAYGRAFPDYLTDTSHRRLLTTLDGRWLNLIRFTDPVGGPVLSWNLKPTCAGNRPAVVGTGITAGAPPLGVSLDGSFLGDQLTRRLLIGNERWLPDPPIEAKYRFARGHSNYCRDPSWPSFIGALVRRDGERH